MENINSLIYFAITMFIIMLIVFPMISFFFYMSEMELLFMESIAIILFFYALIRIAIISNEAEAELLKKEKLSIMIPGKISDYKQIKTFEYKGLIINYVIKDSIIIRK